MLLNLNSNIALTLGYLNSALNNSAQFTLGKGTVEPAISNRPKMRAISCCLTGGGKLKGIEHATLGSADQHSTYWANPATFLCSRSSCNGYSHKRTG